MYIIFQQRCLSLTETNKASTRARASEHVMSKEEEHKK